MYGVNIYGLCAFTVNFWDSYNVFLNFYFNNFVYICKIEYLKNKKTKATQVFQNFGSVGKGQTNIFFFYALKFKI